MCYITVAPVQGFEPRLVVINSHVPCQLGDTGLIAQEGLDPHHSAYEAGVFPLHHRAVAPDGSDPSPLA